MLFHTMAQCCRQQRLDWLVPSSEVTYFKLTSDQVEASVVMSMYHGVTAMAVANTTALG